MKNRNKKVLFALMLGCSITLMATGCDKLKKEPETETEAPTEAPTEKQTETETESETQPQNLTAEEELAQAKEYDQLKSLYAKDDAAVPQWQGQLRSGASEVPEVCEEPPGQELLRPRYLYP